MLFRGRLGNMLESSWSPLAALWRPLEASWGSLGAILGPFWSHLRASWGHLGAPLQPSWDQLEGQRACSGLRQEHDQPGTVQAGQTRKTIESLSVNSEC